MLLLMIYGAISIPENKGQSLVKTEDKLIGTVGMKENYGNKAFTENTKI